MQEKELPKSLRVFELIDDPRRVPVTTLHDLTDIIAITIMATLCGAANWVEIELWAKSKQKWLETVLPLPHGIPSHERVSRVFAMLDPGQMVDAFTAWTSELAQHIKGVVALDGKSVRRSEPVWGIENKVHWILDVAMDEDINRARVGNSAQNLSLIRKVVLNLLRKDKRSKGGVQARQKRAGWDHDDLLELLALG